MNFSSALEYLVLGRRLSLPDWKPGQFIVMNRGMPSGAQAAKPLADALGIQERTIIKMQPYLMMRTPMGEIVPWLPGHVELFAKNWREFEAEEERGFNG